MDAYEIQTEGEGLERLKRVRRPEPARGPAR